MSLASSKQHHDASWASQMLEAQRGTLPTAVLGADGVQIYHVEEGQEPHGVFAGPSFTGRGYGTLMDEPPGIAPDSPWTNDVGKGARDMSALIDGQLASPTVLIPTPNGDFLRTKGQLAGWRKMPLSISHVGGLQFLVQGGSINDFDGQPYNPTAKEPDGSNIIITCPRGGGVVVGVYTTEVGIVNKTFTVLTYSATSEVTYSNPKTFDFSESVTFSIFTPLVAVSATASGAWTIMGYAPPLSR